jgi:hypothetical protein
MKSNNELEQGTYCKRKRKILCGKILVQRAFSPYYPPKIFSSNQIKFGIL